MTNRLAEDHCTAKKALIIYFENILAIFTSGIAVGWIFSHHALGERQDASWTGNQPWMIETSVYVVVLLGERKQSHIYSEHNFK